MSAPAPRSTSRPQVGFLGVGWIGRHRLASLAQSGLVDIVAINDPEPELALAAQQHAPSAQLGKGLTDLLAHPLDAVVIATPSALHAEQTITALEHGLAVFCQKPLGRTGAETTRVVEAAKQADRLLGVDFCYRHLAGVRRLREIVASGEIGAVFAARLVFHNAYGPDKPWFYDQSQSGGGCLVDLGIHLLDLGRWVLGEGELAVESSRCMAEGRTLAAPVDRIEEYVLAHLWHSRGTAVSLECSWRLAAGRDAIIEASFYGTRGGVALQNVEGSFYDFRVERYRGTARETLAAPPDAWGGRAITAWAAELARGVRFDPAILEAVEVAQVIDSIYGRRR